jgi:tetratricopeptide (TPR) repeat protein
MKALLVLILPALFVAGTAGAQTNSTNSQTNAPFTATTDNPPYKPPPTAPRPHVVEVPQPNEPMPPATNAPATAPAPASGDNLDPAKVAEYQKRFQDGYALQQAGKLAEARAIYDGILAEEPGAKRSLLEAGRISFKLDELARANDYLEKLHAIVPDFPEAIELLIQINQALKRDVRVELLIQSFDQLHDSGKIPELTHSLCFVRERLHVDQNDIVISQFFNYQQEPNTVWMAEIFDSAGLLKRRLLLNYDPDATRALRAKDAKYATTQVFTWFEHILQDGKVKEIDAYLQIFALPDYQKFRSAMFIILATPPKPIYSAPVDPQQH